MFDSNNPSKVWFITGCSTGIGRELAFAVLRSGQKVVVTARNTDTLSAFSEEFPKQVLALQLDMQNPEQIVRASEQALQHFGRVDVLVNNAGYGLWGMAEELNMEQVRHQMETNFFGLVHLTQCFLPHFRTQKSGYIINFSSLAGLRGFFGLSAYNASKFAVEGYSEALAQEMKPFGVKVSIVEPGPYRTDWAGRSLIKSSGVEAPDTQSPYYQLNRKSHDRIMETDGTQPGDPAQIAAILIQAAEAENPPLHMLFGDICIQGWELRVQNFEDPAFLKKYPHDTFTL